MPINTAVIEDYLYAQSIKAANQAANHALRRIRDRAPVRRLFRGTTFRTMSEFTSPAGPGRAPINRRVMGSDVTAESATRRKRGVSYGLTAHDMARSAEAFTGHANSFQPLIKYGRSKFTQGDFRKVDKAGRLADVQATLIQSGRSTTVHTRGTQAQFLTSRGRYEVGKGRATFKGHVGGRLRDELRVVPAVREGTHVWAYVVSPTKDPDTGYPYNRAQEFGTVHNRPHPFMRPGLHESRGALVAAVKSNLQTRSR
jgi:HK97 gp10 family phage protein